MQGNYDQQRVVDYLTKHLGKVQSIRNHVLKEYYDERDEERDRLRAWWINTLNTLEVLWILAPAQ